MPDYLYFTILETYGYWIKGFGRNFEKKKNNLFTVALKSVFERNPRVRT